MADAPILIEVEALNEHSRKLRDAASLLVGMRETFGIGSLIGNASVPLREVPTQVRLRRRSRDGAAPSE